jgi:hypothetical protein
LSKVLIPITLSIQLFASIFPTKLLIQFIKHAFLQQLSFLYLLASDHLKEVSSLALAFFKQYLLAHDDGAQHRLI